MIDLDNTPITGVPAIRRHGHHPAIGGKDRAALVGSNINAEMTTRIVAARKVIIHSRPCEKAPAGAPKWAACGGRASPSGLDYLSTRLACAARDHHQLA